ncbi:MAG: DegT/DnrJ/EryC1/StrS family aminotransferase [Candidatus Omnitrophica bacterium]|nr:DegT/DnrJ/EryC1/StrS family aminotransferase [Candidatus Omnitrophota bacterium]
MGIPVCIPVIPKNAKKYVDAVIDKNWVSSLCLDEEVNYLKKLEIGFSGFVGVKYGTAVTSGTAALQLAYAVLKICPGDEVIMPSFTMVATASAAIHSGARPVFVDADKDTWCIDVDKIESLITKKTKAIVPVHMYGHPCDMERIMDIAKKYNLFVIEDAAEAIGTEYKGKKAGSIGDIGCFSFYANKTMTCGEGGMLVTNNENYAKRAAMLKDQAFGQPRFIHEDIGFNFRMNNLNAAYAYASFEEVSDYVAKRIHNAELYNKFLSGIEGIILPPVSKNGLVNSYWMYGIMIDRNKFGMAKQEVRDQLKSQFGVETRDFFYPMHKQPVMLKRGYAKENQQMPVSERLWEDGLYLPSSTNLKEEQIIYVADALKKLKK